MSFLSLLLLLSRTRPMNMRSLKVQRFSRLFFPVFFECRAVEKSKQMQHFAYLLDDSDVWVFQVVDGVLGEFLFQ